MAEVFTPPITLGTSCKDGNPNEGCFLFRRKGLKITAGSHYIPKYNKSKPKGEDAHFICVEKQTIGVADGVGGWAASGIDAGEYARELMKNCVREIWHRPIKCIVPKFVLKEAFERTNKKGSSTGLVLTVKGDILYAVNVGDSGFIVVRGGIVVYRSPVQQRGFNRPYQLGKNRGDDCPDSGLEIMFTVDAGDVIVAGTDGLFDNVYVAEIEDFVRDGMENDIKAEVLARTIAKFAQKKALSADFSPFAMAAREAGVKLKNNGGKYDDITVVVSYVVPSPLEENSSDEERYSVSQSASLTGSSVGNHLSQSRSVLNIN